MFYYNPLDKFCKSVTGAATENEKIVFRVKADFESLVLVVKKDNAISDDFYPMTKSGDFFEREISFSRGLYFYSFYIGNGFYIGLSENYSAEVSKKPSPFQLTVYDKDYIVPDWLSGGIIYQIFPDRFNRGEKEKKLFNGQVLHDNLKDTPEFLPDENGKIKNCDFFGGDFKGIINKIPYIAGLGVTAIYLNPIFKAYSNHRYDTGDYMTIDPLLGDESDFKNLISTANEYGIKIILDGVFNHTGDDSLYFNKYGHYNSVGAYQSINSPYAKWYKFINYPDTYESWWGIDVLPALNKSDEGFTEFLTGQNGVIEKYSKMGIGGWRLDVVDEIPDELVKKIRSAVKRNNQNAIIIGEVWEDATNKISYGKRREYFLGDELDSVMNYPLKNAILGFVKDGNAEGLSFAVKEQIDHYPLNALNSLMNILSTHDTFRLLSAVGGVDVDGLTKSEMANVKIPDILMVKAKFRLKAASLLQYTLYGVPSVYYGDEIGMEGYTDPLNRRFFEWDNMNEEILSWYRLLGKIRRQYKVFRDGEVKEVFARNGVYAFKRVKDDEEIFVAVNVSGEDKKLCFSGTIKNLLDGSVLINGGTLKSNSFAVFAAK